MHKNLFYLLFLVLLAFWATANAQQQAKMPRVGLLRPGSPPDRYVEAFRAVPPSVLARADRVIR
jgi:hypothetical protein